MNRSLVIFTLTAITVFPECGFGQVRDLQALLYGQKSTYSTEGHPKAKGITISIDCPSCWQRSESDSPNILQEFLSETPNGFLMQCMLMIKEQPSFMRHFSSRDISDVMFAKETLGELLPERATFIKGDRTEYDGEPGAWIVYAMQSERAGLKAETYTLQNMFLYSGKLITLQCAVSGLPGSAAKLKQEFTGYLPLFTLIGNSIRIPDKWTNTIGLASILSQEYGEYWALTLIVSAVFTWGIGLTPPLLIRFVFLRRPISKGWAIASVLLFGYVNFAVFCVNAAANGRRPGGAFILIAFASYAILRKSTKRGTQNELPSIAGEHT